MNEEDERETEREGREREPKHSCFCANDSQDHKRLLVPRSKQALSRRLWVPAPTKNLPNGPTLWSLFQDGSNEIRKKKRVHVSWSSQAVLKMAALGANARQVSADEPSGARLFSCDWVEGHCAHDHRAQFELGLKLALSQRRFPLLPEVKIEWAQVWRAQQQHEHRQQQQQQHKNRAATTTQNRENDDNTREERERREERGEEEGGRRGRRGRGGRGGKRGEERERRGRGEEREREEVKMGEGREKEQMMKIMRLKNRKKRCGIRKERTLNFKIYYVFKKKKLIVKHSFPVFLQFFVKNVHFGSN